MRGWESAEQLRRYHVDAFVGALRAQYRCDEQLERCLEVELAVRVGILALQSLQNLERMCGETRASFDFSWSLFARRRLARRGPG